MPKMAIVVCKLGPKVEPSRSKLKNGQATYWVLMSIQVGRHVDHIDEGPS
jgi:hypothetical protein